jgi:hypothetical protein
VPSHVKIHVSPSPVEQVWPSTNRQIYCDPACRKIWSCVAVQIHWTATLSPVQCGPNYRHSVIFCKLWTAGGISVPVVCKHLNKHCAHATIMQNMHLQKMSLKFCKNCLTSPLLCRLMTQIITGNDSALQHHSGNLQSKF